MIQMKNIGKELNWRRSESDKLKLTADHPMRGRTAIDAGGKWTIVEQEIARNHEHLQLLDAKAPALNPTVKHWHDTEKPKGRSTTAR